MYSLRSLFMMCKASETRGDCKRWIPLVEIGLMPGGLFPASNDGC